jgi:AraC-like DNA-binding protein
LPLAAVARWAKPRRARLLQCHVFDAALANFMKSTAGKNQDLQSGQEHLPVHSLAKREFPLFVKAIQYKNPYDFTRVHRHDYFEIFFFETGGGSQLIDFIEMPVNGNSCYIVFPLQVHLLRRSPEASGRLVQFRDEAIAASDLKNLLQQASFGMNTAAIFENNPRQLQQVSATLDLLKKASEKHSVHSREISLHFLQALIFQLLERRQTQHKSPPSADRKLAYRFQQLLEEQYLHDRSVQHYAALLNLTEKKLSAITKKYWGLNPLQVIHNRLLLEAKRLLLFEDTSHKEIAFHLNFDSPASFSQLVKNKTGLFPSALQKRLAKIHK